MTQEQSDFIQGLRNPGTMIIDIANEYDLSRREAEILLWEWLTTDSEEVSA